MWLYTNHQVFTRGGTYVILTDGPNQSAKQLLQALEIVLGVTNEEVRLLNA